MKHLLKTSLVFILLIVATSCSTNDIDENQQIRGIWDNVEIDGEEMRTFRLVFGKENSGANIYKVELSNGQGSSSIASFEWNLNNDVIEIIEEGKIQDEYYLNSEGQLVSSSNEDLILNKISDDYSRYSGDE